MSKKSAIFQKVKIKSVGSSRFDLSHDVKLTFDMGQLIPHAFEVIPGDRLTLSCESMIRVNPFAQKGDQVTIPLVAQDVLLKDYTQITAGVELIDPDTGIDTAIGNVEAIQAGGATKLRTTDQEFTIDPAGSLYVGSGASPVENLRRAFRLQEWLEINARAGTRYTEFLIGHFNESNGDHRLQRPHLIGQTTHNMIISEVLATAEGTTNPVGEMAGHGIAVNKGYKHKYKVKDYGWIFCITSVTPFTAYEGGIHKSLSRDSYLDYYIPSFQNIGEQEIYNKELYVGDELVSPETTDAVFGYTPRYSAYKYLNNSTHGNFKGTSAASLNFWHLGRYFTTQPNLNDDFVKCLPDTRIYAVEDPNIHNLYAHMFFNISAVRKMAKYAIPGY